MNVDQFIAANLPARFQVSELDMFKNFTLDMTESYHTQWNEDGRVERVPAMQRISGQKESERKLWHIKPASQDNVAKLDKAEHAERLAATQASYAADDNFELEVDPYTFAIGLANACRAYGFEPTFLLDEDGEF